MRALLLRVGIDKGRSSGGCLAPIFSDATFEYIPIIEGCDSSETRTYSSMKTANGSPVLAFVPATIRDRHPHYDPEFESYTYGDPTPNKRRQLLQLKKGDLLVFYAGLDPQTKADVPRLFVIGYFTVRRVHDFDCLTPAELTSLREKLRNNAHIKRHHIDDGLVIVEGDPGESQLLSRALPLGDAFSFALRDLCEVTGYKGSLLRAIGHWADGQYSLRTKMYLEAGVPALVESDSHLFSYVLATDAGFAPNVGGGYCTLACCKPEIRRTARVGDWVMGTMPHRFGGERLSYLMRVGETLSFDEYFADARFQRKKPAFHPDGDNIYSVTDGSFVQMENRHHGIDEMAHDTRVNRVLVGSLFWYFGEDAPGLPSQLWSAIRRGRGHRRVRDCDLVRAVVSWVSSRYRPGLMGRPRDSDEAAARPSTISAFTAPAKCNSDRMCGHREKPKGRRDP